MTPRLKTVTQRIIFLSLCLSLSLLFSGCSRRTSGPSATPTPAMVSSADVVRASAAEVQISPGGSADAVVNVTIQSGYHINANPASDAYLIATELTLKPDDGFSVGFITYPTPLTKKFSFSDKQLAVYEGETAIKIYLKATKSATRGQHSFAGKLNVQACDDQVCYAPGTIDLAIPVSVK